MNPFSSYNLPITIIVTMLAWAWFSLISALVGSLL